MGTEAIWVPLVTAAVSAGASYYNTNRTARKQDDALAAQLRGQQQRQREADSKVQNIIAEQAQSTPDDERTQASENYRKALLAAKSGAQGGLSNLPGASDAFKDASSKASADIGEYGQRIAGLLSTIDAPYMQRQNEGNTLNRRAGELDILSRIDSGATWLDELRLRGIRRNPWLDALSSAAQGYSQYSASGSTLGGSDRGG